MKICVAGLGLIGGSMCLSLKRAGYAVYGYDRSAGALGYALRNEIIDGAAASFENFDVVFVALPPQAAAEFIVRTPFADGAIVADVCGVKKPIERAVYAVERNFRYVGCHPMAGKEVSGIENACADLFDYANLVVTICEKTDEDALVTLRSLAADMGFGRVVECSADIHDGKIAYTSQLAHVVSNAYARDGEIDCCLGFTGGSFQDMTRIACVNENDWAELYLQNAENLSVSIGNLVSSLEEIRSAIEAGDPVKLAETLKKGRASYENSKKAVENSQISVTNLR